MTHDDLSTAEGDGGSEAAPPEWRMVPALPTDAMLAAAPNPPTAAAKRSALAQPMATAPLDGTYVLLRCPEAPSWWVVGRWGRAWLSDGWIETGNITLGLGSYYGEPTGWVALPTDATTMHGGEPLQAAVETARSEGFRAGVEAAAEIARNFTSAAHIAHDMRVGRFPTRSMPRDALSEAIRALATQEARHDR